MAVEAPNLNLFPSQLIGNRELMMSVMEGSNLNIYNTPPTGYGLPPLSGTTTADTLLFPMYGSAVTDSIPAPKNAMKADSGLTYAFPVSRKRSRDSTNPFISFPNAQILNRNNNNNNHTPNCGGFFTFLGEDISLHIQQQQLEIDRFVTQHTEKVRLEMEEQRKGNTRRMIAAVEEGIRKKLRGKEMEVEKIGKLNWGLEERVKSLCVENQIWRELAQTNEATVNALRSNLEQVLAHVNNNNDNRGGALEDGGGGLMDDAQSCCGSNYYYVGSGDCGKQVVKKKKKKDKGGSGCDQNSSSSISNRLCRQCGKEESCVLLMPCRHLCVCTFCGSSVQACPVCNSVKNASLRVILPS